MSTKVLGPTAVSAAEVDEWLRVLDGHGAGFKARVDGRCSDMRTSRKTEECCRQGDGSDYQVPP